MEKHEMDAVLKDRVTTDLIERSPVMRVAYTGPDGAPRVVPVAYIVRDGQFVFWRSVLACHIQP